MSERRYRQQGYQQKPGERRDKNERPAPASPSRTLGSRAVSRCAECGGVLPPGIDALGRCPGCGAALHACKQCAHFDPGRRFECTETIPERISDKVARNECPSFSLRVVVERDVSSGSVRPDDARRAFDSLFKKPRP
ncbi:MAG TPA: hypothetical protein VGW35_08235 [Methylomirabilota bacterium]|nr:hypothetical protein [Methylomirabilota bacterium]